jgi:4-amino-4-deoxy-L-arabinose transferase-like glycosyltransferase
MRALNAILSLLVLPTAALLYYKIFKNRLGALLTFILLAFNWKLIVHAHYVNADIFITILLTLAYLTAYLYYKKPTDSLYTWLTGLLIGLAIGTKVTAGLTLPLFLYLFAVKKDLKGALGFILIAFLTFEITNPFSIIFLNEFVFRVVSMFSREGGMVFDSIDTNPFKYLIALGYMVTPFVFASSAYGIYLNIKNKTERPIHIFLIGHIVFYLIFYSIQSRRVDRWLLPIIPIIIIYASYGLIKLKELLKGTWALAALIIVVGISYMYFPIMLLAEFRRYTPKSEAYLWTKNNLPPISTKLTITEEGLDPMNKAPLSTVVTYEVYGDKNAQYGYPPNPTLYDYVILSSRPMTNFKRKEVMETYPLYSKAWQSFENTVTKSGKFSLVKSFVLPKPNLIPLSDVYIYKQNL